MSDLRCCAVHGHDNCRHAPHERHHYCPFHGAIQAGYPGQAHNATRCHVDGSFWRKVVHTLTGWGRAPWEPHPEVVEILRRAQRGGRRRDNGPGTQH